MDDKYFSNNQIIIKQDFKGVNTGWGREPSVFGIIRKSLVFAVKKFIGRTTFVRT
jgi:hypothetical protein